MIVLKKLIGNYAKKIRNYTDYNELKLEMKSHEKGNNKIFEINALVIFNNERLSAKAEGYNPFVLIDDVLKRLIKETEHKIRKEKWEQKK